MAVDLNFDTVTREMVIVNGDFSLIENASVQKGNIIQYSAGAFVQTPALGVGMENIINAKMAKVSVEMNRWREQCLADSAQKADWNHELIDPIENVVQINTKIYYD